MFFFEENREDRTSRRGPTTVCGDKTRETTGNIISGKGGRRMTRKPGDLPYDSLYVPREAEHAQ